MFDSFQSPGKSSLTEWRGRGRGVLDRIFGKRYCSNWNDSNTTIINSTGDWWTRKKKWNNINFQQKIGRNRCTRLERDTFLVAHTKSSPYLKTNRNTLTGELELTRLLPYKKTTRWPKSLRRWSNRKPLSCVLKHHTWLAQSKQIVLTRRQNWEGYSAMGWTTREVAVR